MRDRKRERYLFPSGGNHVTENHQPSSCLSFSFMQTLNSPLQQITFQRGRLFCLQHKLLTASLSGAASLGKYKSHPNSNVWRSNVICPDLEKTQHRFWQSWSFSLEINQRHIMQRQPECSSGGVERWCASVCACEQGAGLDGLPRPPNSSSGQMHWAPFYLFPVIRVVSGDQFMRFIQSWGIKWLFFTAQQRICSFTPRGYKNSIQYWPPLPWERVEQPRVRRRSRQCPPGGDRGRGGEAQWPQHRERKWGRKSRPFWAHSLSSPWGQAGRTCDQRVKKKWQCSPVLRSHLQHLG